MANIRVKDLPNTNSAADTDEFIIDSSTAGTRRLSYSELKSEISTDFQGDVNTYKIATLASDNKLDPSQIPDTLSQGLNFVGVANSAGDLTSTTQGDFYVIQTAFDSYQVGDQAVYNGSSYTRVTDGTKQIAEGGTGATTLDAAKVNLEIANVGTDPSEVPLNQHLGSLAYQSAEAVSMASAEVETLEVTDSFEVIPPGNDINPGIISKVGAFLSSNSEVGLGFSGFPSGDGASKSAIIHERKDTYGRGDLHICSNYAADATNADKSDAVITVDGSTDRVGIKTTSPDTELHISASSGATIRLESTTPTLSTGGVLGAIEFETQDAGSEGVNAKINSVFENTVGATSLQFFTSESFTTVPATPRWTINSTGNLVAGANLGIDFGATNTTTGVTVTGSTLDHYEEGTATITDESGAGLTLTSPVCNYTRIGNKVTCWITVTYPATSDTSTAKIGGLPYAFQSVNNVKRIGGFVSYTDYGTALTILGDGGQSRVSIRSHATGAQRTNADLSGKSIWFCLIYEVA